MCRLLLILMCTTLTAHAVSIRDRLSYEPLSRLIKKYETLIAQEKGRFAHVPFSPRSSSTTPIYIHFVTGYKPHRATVIFIPGGPGGSTHQSAGDLNDFARKFDVNVLAIDPRGTGLSRPESASEYWSDQYLSTRQSAYDLESIRKQLGLSQVYLWGRSYGTMTATLAASLFPQSFKGIILEGTLTRFRDHDEFRSIHSHTLQDFLSSLPNQFSTQFKTKLKFLIQSAMYEYGSLRFDEYRNFIARNTDLSESRLLGRLQTLFPEMSILDRIQSDPLAINRKTYERIRSIDQNLDLTNHNVMIPTLILQGQDDPVCFREGASRLFKSLSLTKSQWIEFERAGHHLLSQTLQSKELDSAVSNLFNGHLDRSEKIFVTQNKSPSIRVSSEPTQQCVEIFN